MKKILLVFFCLTGLIFTFAQTATISSYTQNIDCPSTGSASVATKVTSPSFILYDATSNNLVAGPQTSSTFSQLMAGTYYIKVVGDNGSATTGNFTINSNYKPMTAADVSITNVCGSYQPGGAIKVNGVTGGNGPYTYLFVKSSNPNFDDSAMTYTINNTYNATSFDTYQIRIKDACGATYTVSKTLSATLAPAKDMYFGVANNVDCTGTKASLYNYTFYNANGGALDYTAYADAGGILVEMWEQTGGSCPATAPTSPPIFSQKIVGSSYVIPIVASKKYIVRMTTPCGEQSIVCLDQTFEETRSFAASVLTSKKACNSPETMSITPTENYFFNFPVKVEVTDKTGAIVYTKSNIGSATADIYQNNADLNSWNVSGLPLGDYTVTYTDNCGARTSKVFSNPANAGDLAISGADYFLWRCGDIPVEKQTGTTQIGVYNTGYMPNSANATVTIISGPSNVGVRGVLLGNYYYGWSNILPGTYTIEVKDPACGTTTQLTGVVNPDPSDLLQQSLTSVGKSVCSGGGDINSTFKYNGDYSYIIELLDSSGNVLQSNSTGNFTNLPAGTYSTRIAITPWCDENNPYYVEGSTVTLTAAGQAPVISRRTGIICEDGAGNPTTYGNIYVKTEGVAPITLQYRLAGNPAWTTATSNAAENETISNLALGNYEVRAIDGCGNSTASYPTSLVPVGQISATNTSQPCYNSPYELKVPNYDLSQVTYQWLNSSGQTVATTYNYVIPNYTSGNDGTYTAIVKLGTCVTRTVKITLNGASCGQPIGTVCYRTADTSGGINSLYGISSLGRAGVSQDNWPMIRQSAHIVLESRSKGFVINRMATDSNGQVPSTVIPSPVKGMMIYDTTNACLKIYDGTSWKCFTKPSCPVN